MSKTKEALMTLWGLVVEPHTRGHESFEIVKKGIEELEEENSKLKQEVVNIKERSNKSLEFNAKLLESADKEILNLKKELTALRETQGKLGILEKLAKDKMGIFIEELQDDSGNDYIDIADSYGKSFGKGQNLNEALKKLNEKE